MGAIATELKQHMHCQGVNARELARRANVKSSFIYDILNGKSTNPSTVKLSKVAQALGVNLSQLVDPTPQMAAPSLNVISSEPFDASFAPPYVNVTYTDHHYSIDTQPDTPYLFSKRWLLNQFRLPLQQLVLCHITSDAMSPTLLCHDVVLIDRGNTLPSPPGIFILCDGHSLSAKRLEYMHVQKHEWVRVTCDNPCYAQQEAQLGELDIIGKVVWYARNLG